MVTTPPVGALGAIYDRVRDYLEQGGIDVSHFSDVVPNPSTDCVAEGAKQARDFGAEVVLGVGGGSSMDTAKAIAVEAAHPGTSGSVKDCV